MMEQTPQSLSPVEALLSCWLAEGVGGGTVRLDGLEGVLVVTVLITLVELQCSQPMFCRH